jgi:predicted enzyme related to lactoylglutathione lyase
MLRSRQLKASAPTHLYLHRRRRRLNTYFDKAKAAGGTVAMDKMDVPKVGKHSIFQRPDGNLFGMIQPDMSGM